VSVSRSPTGFAANGYGDLGPRKYNVVACFVVQLVTAFFFLPVILGSTHRLVPAGSARSRSGWR
jgi:aquaporin Z